MPATHPSIPSLAHLLSATTHTILAWTKKHKPIKDVYAARLMDLTNRKDLVSHKAAVATSQSNTDPDCTSGASFIGKHADSRSLDLMRRNSHDAVAEDLSSPYRSKAGAPIAQVLNVETPSLQGAQSAGPGFAPAAPPFSGRLADLLLDPLEPVSSRTEPDIPSTQLETVLAGTSVITLPKLPQLPVKTVKRPRIPPLLQGLHHPPPLPTGRLFPPITSDQNAFSDSRAERRAYDLQHAVTAIQDAGDCAKQVSDLSVGLEQSRLVVSETEGRAVQENKTVAEPENPDGISHVREPHIEATSRVGNKPSRKRKRWSTEETRDLLLGVSRFGIGNWKKILQCPEFSFEGRTAVDLKDRFRVCRPGDGLKQRTSKNKVIEAELSSPQSNIGVSPAQGPNVSKDSITSNAKANPSIGRDEQPSGKSTMNDSRLAEIGIRTPFVRNSRRPRREFTEEDDVNLLKGFERHGSSWHSMRDDIELGFSSRHPTDLRDRFRIKYPTKYAKAGYKLKRQNNVDCSAPHITGTAQNKQSYKPDSISSGEMQRATTSTRVVNSSNTFASTPNSKHTHPPGKSHDTVNYLARPLSTLADTNEIVYDYGFGDESPPTLNRDILQWADASTSASALAPSSTNNHMNDLIHGDMTWGIFTPGDLMHINSTTTMFPNDSSPAAKERYGKPLDRQNHITTIASSPTKPSSTPSSSSLLAPTTATTNSRTTMPQTPNLPNIVFPHVPAASARNTVHNLPGPADLLSVDLDRPLPQNLVTTLDDALGFVNSA